MKKTAIIAFGIAILMTACTTTKTVISQPEAPKAEETTPVVSLPTVTPSTEFISITEAISLLDNPQQTAELAKKYGYKIINDYAVYRLDAYKPMMYKNCRPAKAMGANVYEDMPKPLRKGVSSYIAMRDDVTIGVFNEAAYSNLVQQLAATGFTLERDGYEQVFTNGTIMAYCHASRKTVRLAKN